MAKKTLAESANEKIGKWTQLTQSRGINELLKDTENLNFRQFNKKYQEHYKSNESLRGTLQRVKNQLDYANAPVSKDFTDSFAFRQAKFGKTRLGAYKKTIDEKTRERKVVKVKHKYKQKNPEYLKTHKAKRGKFKAEKIKKTIPTQFFDKKGNPFIKNVRKEVVRALSYVKSYPIPDMPIVPDSVFNDMRLEIQSMKNVWEQKNAVIGVSKQILSLKIHLSRCDANGYPVETGLVATITMGNQFAENFTLDVMLEESIRRLKEVWYNEVTKRYPITIQMIELVIYEFIR